MRPPAPVLLAGLVAALLLLAPGCASPRAAAIQHVVLFRLAEARQADALLADCDALLPAIPSVVAYHAGRHVDVGRDGVLADYDVGLVVGFEDVEGYRAYLDDPAHLRIVERWRPAFADVRIYDVLDTTR